MTGARQPGNERFPFPPQLNVALPGSLFVPGGLDAGSSRYRNGLDNAVTPAFQIILAELIGARRSAEQECLVEQLHQAFRRASQFRNGRALLKPRIFVIIHGRLDQSCRFKCKLGDVRNGVKRLAKTKIENNGVENGAIP